MDMQDYMLTTIDNPYNPFTDFDNWYQFDVDKGYNTSQYLARIANVSDELSEADQTYYTNLAINEIVDLNILGLYKKVLEKDYKEGGSMTVQRKLNNNHTGEG